MRLLPNVLAIGLCAAAAAQHPGPVRPDLSDTSAVALNRSDGTLRAYGGRYEAVFDADGVDFQPTLGVETAAPSSLRLEVRSIGRAGGEFTQVARAEQTVDGLRVRYRRPTFDELYDAHAGGIEQSFVFRSVPRGSGDLIVRLDLATPFAAHPDGAWTADGIAFDLAGVRGGATISGAKIGAATIGAVTGIDADGRRCRGALRCVDGRTLELSLPAKFVDTAALPLVLDPWISGAFDGSGGGGTYAEDRADVAYSAATDSYMLVWQREIAGVFQIRGRTVRCDGTVLTAFVGINTSTTSKIDPSVAMIASQDSYLVSWTENLNIRATAVTSTGTVFSTAGINVAATAGFEAESDVGGQKTANRTDGIVVWSNLSQRHIEAKRVRVLRAQNVVQNLGNMVDISARSGFSTYQDASPAISKCGEDSGRHLIVWSRAGADAEIRGQVVDYGLGIVDSVTNITANTLDDVAPDCDGDGGRWVVTWEQREVSGASRDVKAAAVSLTAANEAIARGEVAIGADPGDLEHQPVVAWLAHTAVIGYLDETGGVDDAFVVRVDPFTAIPFAGRDVVESSSHTQTRMAIAARRPAQTGVTAMVAWTDTLSAGSSTIRARCFDPAAGITRLGGGCGAAGGQCFAAGAVVGNARFALRLRGSQNGAVATLVLSPDRLDRSCGPCALVPDPFRGFLLNATVDPFGEATVQIPIPNQSVLRGLTVLTQWVVPAASPSCTTIASDFSDALSVQIQ